MPNCQKQLNRIDGRRYMASIIPINKRIRVPVDLDGIPFEPIKFDSLIFQATIYGTPDRFPLMLVFTKPLVVVNLDSLPGRVTEDEFTLLVKHLVSTERIDDLYLDGKYYGTFKRYGFESVRYDITSVWLGRVRHIFIFRSLDSRNLEQSSECRTGYQRLSPEQRGSVLDDLKPAESQARANKGID